MSATSAYAVGEDNTAPRLTKVQCSPTEVTKPGVIDIVYSIEENETGVGHICICLKTVDTLWNGNDSGNDFIQYEVDLPQLVYSGTHSAQIPIPAIAKNGDWTITFFSLDDNANNSSNYWVNNTKAENFDGKLLLESHDSQDEYGNYTEYIDNIKFDVKSEFDIAFQYGANNPNLGNALTSMKDGEAGEILVNDRTGYMIPAAAFSAIKGQDKYLIINGDGIEWIFYGKNIFDEDRAIDTRTSVSNVSGSVYGVGGDVVQVVFADNGNLPGKAQIRLKSDYLYNKVGIKGTVYVYYKDGNSVKYESSSNELVMDGTDKWCYFDIDHNSTFILAPQKLSTTSSVGKWSHNSKGWWYTYPDNTYAKGIQKIGNATYYFDNAGWMKTGWQKLDNKWYYFGAKNDGAMKTGWKMISGKWYYMSSDGVMQTGKQTIDKKTYFLADSGAMRTGWVKDDGKWFYCKSSGEATIGWQKVKGTWYYMNSDATMATGWIEDGKAKYYMQASGAMSKGWKKIDNAWYYFNGSGAMQTGWQKVSDKWYYMDSDGKMLTGKQAIGKDTYFLNSSGAMQTGWSKEDNNWYYYNKSGAMQVSKWISGKYWVNADGIMATNTWVDSDKFFVNAKGEWIPNAKKQAQS